MESICFVFYFNAVQWNSSFASFFSDFVFTIICRTIQHWNRTTTVLCSFSSERHNKLPIETPAFSIASFQYFLINIRLRKWIEYFLGKFFLTKSDLFFLISNIQWNFQIQQYSMSDEKHGTSERFSRTKLYFAWHFPSTQEVWKSETVTAASSWSNRPHQKVFTGAVFLDKIFNSPESKFLLLGKRINFQGFTIDFKNSNWLLLSSCVKLCEVR